MYLVRKINRAKWERTNGLAPGEIPADAVTVDLRTMNNSLSFWRYTGDQHEGLREAVLALAAGFERLDKADVVWLPEEDLRRDGLVLANTPGRTPLVDPAVQHVDVCNLDYNRLGKIATHVVRAIEQERFRRWTRNEVRQLLRDALDAGRLVIDRLQMKLRNDL